jgi:proteasome accessory factor C
VSAAPPGSAKDQVVRLLRLVPYLYARGTVRVDEAAADLGVSPARLVSDLKVLFMCGLPGGYPDDLIDVDLDALEGDAADGVIRVSNADYLARPLQLSPTEATAVIVALRALRDGAGDATRQIVDRTVAKLETAVHGAADPLVDPGTGTGVDVLGARFRTTLEEATEQARQVRLTYWVPSRDDVTDRVVDPRGIVTAHGLTYLDAWCHTAQAPRLFRLDRIQDAEVLDSSIQTPAEPPRDLAEGMFQHSADTLLATLRLAPPAHWVVEYYPVEQVRPQPDGDLEVDLVLADERWLRRLLLRLAPHARVVAPAQVAESFSAAAREAHSLYT